MSFPPPPPPKRRPPSSPPAPPAERRARVEATFNSALERPTADREAYLVTACGDDSDMEREVRGLLTAHSAAAGFLDTEAPLSPEIERELARLKPEESGERIGPYKLLQQIGEGGFGTVWMAEQEQPVRRRVALKILKMGMDTKEVIARFEQERQALAMMDHPNIAKVFDAGATPFGRPFFVMELVRGVKITDYCDEQALSTAERVALFADVCQAVQHAHQKGIIHRDIKPTNILVTVNDGAPVPKVIDFGVAKATQGRLTDLTLFTQFEQMIGTPLYMSPEQAEMTSLDIDTRSDIYSLGVLLYELLTGSTPIDTATLRRAGIDEIRSIIREVDPPKPSARVKTLGGADLTTAAQRRHTDGAKIPPQLRGDLDWIVMKCLEKDRHRRYESASALAQDLRRHLANEVITARPPTAGYLLGKVIRRHKLMFVAAAAVAVAILIGLAVSTFMFLREKAAREDALQAKAEATRAAATATTEAARASVEAERANQQATAATEARNRADGALLKTRETIAQLRFRKAVEAIEAGRFAEALSRLAAILREQPNHPTAGSLIVSILSHRSFPVPVGTPLPRAGRNMILGPGGMLLTFDVATPAQLFDLTTRQPVGAPFSAGNLACFSKDGRRLYIGGSFRWSPKTDYEGGVLRVWDVEKHKLLATLGHEGSLIDFHVAEDDSRIVTSEPGIRVRVWDGADFSLLRDGLKLFSQNVASEWILSRDGRFLVDKKSILNIDTGDIFALGNAPGLPVVQHPSLPAFLSMQATWTLRNFDGVLVSAARRQLELTGTSGHSDQGYLIDPTGTRLATGGLKHIVWDLQTGDFAAAPLPALAAGDSGRESGARACSPEGLRVVSVGDGALQPWSMIDGERLGEAARPPFRDPKFWNPAFLPDGLHIAAPGVGTTVDIWQIADGREMPLVLCPVEGAGGFLLHPDGRLLVVGSYTGRGARCVDLKTFQPVGELMRTVHSITSLTLAPDGKTLAIAGFFPAVRVFELPSGRLLSEAIQPGEEEYFFAHPFTPDGERILVGRGGILTGWLSLWEWRTGKRVWSVDLPRGAGGSLHLSPDGSQVHDSRGGMFDVATGQWKDGAANGLITPSWSRTFGWSHGKWTFLDPLSGKPNGPTISYTGDAEPLSFSQDERVLATLSKDRRIRFWSVENGSLIAPPLELRGQVNASAFSPDGRRFAIGMEDGTLQVWDVASGLPLSLRLPHSAPVTQVGWSKSGQQLFACIHMTAIVVHDFPELETPAPQWLAELAETIAGERIDADDATSRSDVLPLTKVRERLLASSPVSPWGQWLRWFFADRATRTASAFSSRSTDEAVAQLRALKTLETAQEVWRRRPTDPAIMIELADQYSQVADSEMQSHAKFLRTVAEWNRAKAAASEQGKQREHPGETLPKKE